MEMVSFKLITVFLFVFTLFISNGNAPSVEELREDCKKAIEHDFRNIAELDVVGHARHAFDKYTEASVMYSNDSKKFFLSIAKAVFFHNVTAMSTYCQSANKDDPQFCIDEIRTFFKGAPKNRVKIIMAKLKKDDLLELNDENEYKYSQNLCNYWGLLRDGLRVREGFLTKSEFCNNEYKESA